MKSIAINRVCGFVILLVSLSFFAPYPGMLKGAEIPSFEDIIEGKALAPTIEDLTGGKVKIGDLIDKNNMALVKEYLGAGVIECLNQGLVMEMTELAPPEVLVPSYFRDLTA